MILISPGHVITPGLIPGNTIQSDHIKTRSLFFVNLQDSTWEKKTCQEVVVCPELRNLHVIDITDLCEFNHNSFLLILVYNIYQVKEGRDAVLNVLPIFHAKIFLQMGVKSALCLIFYNKDLV